MSTINPDPSKIPAAVGATEKAVERFLSPKVRAGIYAVAGVIAVVAGAAAPVFGGVVGDTLGVVAAAAAAVVGSTALSHVSK